MINGDLITGWQLNHPFEKYLSNWISSATIGVQLKTWFETTTQIIINIIHVSPPAHVSMRSHRALYPIQPTQTTKHVQHDTLHTSQNKSQGNSPPEFFWNHNPTQFTQLCIHKWPLTAIFYHLHSFCQSHHLHFLTLTRPKLTAKRVNMQAIHARNMKVGWRSTKKHPTGKFIEKPYVLIQSGFPEIIFDEELGSSIGCGNTDTHII